MPRVRLKRSHIPKVSKAILRPLAPTWRLSGLLVLIAKGSASTTHLTAAIP